jgi:hypothetical protein
VERERGELLGREVGGEVGVDEPGRDRAAARGLEVHAGAVVGDGDVDRVLLAARVDPDAARLGLAGGRAQLGPLDAVVDRVADQVHERVAEAVEDRAIELELAARDLDLDALAEPLRDVAREARQRLHAAQQRRRAQRERAPLELPDRTVHAVEARGEHRAARGPLPARRAHLARVQDHLAHGREEAVERVRAHAHGG